MKRTRSPIHFLTCLFCLLTLGQVIGQKPNFKNFNTQHGLPSSEIYDMYQDVNGYMWFATDRGISRYDGYSFKAYGLEDGLTGTVVFEFFPQDNGDIWCTTMNNELFYFNPKDYKFHPYKFNESLKKHASSYTVEKFIIDSQNTVHVSFEYQATYISIDSLGNANVQRGEWNSEILLDGAWLTVEKHGEAISFAFVESTQSNQRDFEPFIQKKFDRPKTNLGGGNRCLTEVNKNTVLFSWGRELYVSHDKKNFTKMIVDKEIIRLGFLSQNYYWAGQLNGGVDIFDFQGNLVQHLFDKETVTDVLSDHEGGFWFSTLSSGAYYVQNTEVIIYAYPTCRHVSSISKTARNNLFVNAMNGDSYQIKDEKIDSILESKYGITSLFEHYQTTEVVYHDHLLTDSKSVLRQGFESGQFVPRGLSDDHNQVPLLFSRHAFSAIHKNELSQRHSIKNLRVMDVSAGEKGVYIASRSGLYFHDSLLGKTTQIKLPKLDCFISEIDRIAKDRYILGTKGLGIILLNKGKTISIDKSDGLLSNIITEVYVENDSTYWACTNQGLNMIQFSSTNPLKIYSFTVQDGLIDNDVTDVEIIDGTVWIATKFGLCSIPKEAITKNRVCAHYFFELTHIRTKKMPTELLSALSYYNNHLEFHYKAISFANNHVLEFRYKLIGLDNSWNYTKELSVIYESVPPGNYTLEIQLGMDGEWTQERILQNLTILPPFYSTWWFRVLVICTILALIYLFFKLRILSYNKYILREVGRQILKRIKRDEKIFTVRIDGKDVKVYSREVLFVSADGNYIEIHTKNERFIVRKKLVEFLEIVPDPLEYLQIRRSHIVRIDQITQKSKTAIVIGDTEIKIGITYIETCEKTLI